MRVVRTERAAFTSLPARAPEAVLSVSATGEVRQGALVAADIPGTLTAPLVLTGGVAPPSASTRSVGTRVVLFPQPGIEYAHGIEDLFLWASVPVGAGYRWYQGDTQRLALGPDGTLALGNGSGVLSLGSSIGVGRVEAATFLGLQAGGPIGVSTTLNAALYPASPYWTNLGSLANKWLSIHGAELWVETLVAADTMATIGGRVLVGPTTTLVKPQTASTATFGFYCKHNQMIVEDRVRLEAAGKFEIWRITAGPTSHPADTEIPFPYYSYGAERLLGGPWGWDAGDAIANTGQPGNGFLDLYAVRGAKVASEAGPTIVGNVRTAYGATDWEPRWAIGHLSGLYGNAPGVYGAAFGAPTTGLHLQIDATNGILMLNGSNVVYSQWAMDGTILLGAASAPNLRLSAGEIRLRNATVDKFLVSADGNAYLASALVVGTPATAPDGAEPALAASVRSRHATAWDTGRGFLFRYYAPESPLPDMTTALIGDAAGQRMQWDGSNLHIYGKNVVITPSTGITVLSTPSTTWQPTYGYNLTNLTWGGWASMWAYEILRSSDSWAERAVVLDNMTTNSNSYAKHVIQGQGRDPAGAPAMAYSLTCESTGAHESSFVFAGGHTTFQTGGGIRMLGALMIGADRAATTQIELTADSAMKPATSLWQITPSNADAKTAIAAVDPEEALGIVRRAPIKRFAYTGKYGAPVGLQAIGMLAEEAEALMPASVTWADSGAAAWNAHELLMLTIVAVQELANRLEGEAAVMTQDQKIAYAESSLFRGEVKGNCLKYADEQIRMEAATQYELIPGEPTLSKAYYDARVRVSQTCLNSPDQFAMQHAASIAQMLADPVTADDLAVLGAVINLWESLAGGKPVPVPAPPAGAPTGRAA